MNFAVIVKSKSTRILILFFNHEYENFYGISHSSSNEPDNKRSTAKNEEYVDIESKRAESGATFGRV